MLVLSVSEVHPAYRTAVNSVPGQIHITSGMQVTAEIYTVFTIFWNTCAYPYWERLN